MSRKLALTVAPLLGFVMFALLLAMPSWAEKPPEPAVQWQASIPAVFFFRFSRRTEQD